MTAAPVTAPPPAAIDYCGLDVALMQTCLKGATPCETAERGWELVDALLERVRRG